MIPILVLRICAVRNSGHKHDHITWHIIFITVLRPLILLKCVKFSDQGNTQSVSEKRDSKFLTYSQCSHIRGAENREMCASHCNLQWMKLTERNLSWHSGGLWTSPCFISLVWFCGTDRYGWRFCRSWAFWAFQRLFFRKRKWNCRIKFLGPRTLRYPEIQAEFA